MEAQEPKGGYAMLTIHIDCDVCKTVNGHTAFGGGISPADIKQALYSAGWRNMGAGKEHVCPTCMMYAQTDSPLEVNKCLNYLHNHFHKTNNHNYAYPSRIR